MRPLRAEDGLLAGALMIQSLNRITLGSIVAVLILGCSGTSDVNEDGPPPAPYLSEPFDVSTWALGLRFRGHNVRSIREALGRAGPYKSEFETADEYRRRFPPKQSWDRLRPTAF
jgi:hypothetical protein